LVRGLSPHHRGTHCSSDAMGHQLRSFRRRSPEDPAACSSAPPGSHAAPPAPRISARGKRRKQYESCLRTAQTFCRLTVSAARTNVALLIRRAVRCSRSPSRCARQGARSSPPVGESPQGVEEKNNMGRCLRTAGAPVALLRGSRRRITGVPIAPPMQWVTSSDSFAVAARRLGCTPLRSARVPCGTTHADATGHQLALRSEASKSRCARPGEKGASWRAQGGRVKWRPFGAPRRESPLGGGR
jgi:hypothetical protein